MSTRESERACVYVACACGGVCCTCAYACVRACVVRAGGGARVHRSEEHTSELQSLTNLVCRLLLEKKKKKKRKKKREREEVERQREEG